MTSCTISLFISSSTTTTLLSYPSEPLPNLTLGYSDDGTTNVFSDAIIEGSSVLGGKHPDIVLWLTTLSGIYNAQNDSVVALKYAENALDKSLELFGQKSQATVDVFNTFKRIYERIGNHELARDYGEQSVLLAEEVFGRNSSERADALFGLGGIHHGVGNHVTCIRILREGLDIRLQLLGENHPNLSPSFNLIGASYYKIGDSNNAIGFTEKALDIRRRLLGDQHTSTVDTAYGLVLILLSLRERTKAFQLLDEFLRNIPESHDDYQFLLRKMETILSEQVRSGFRQTSFRQYKEKLQASKKKRFR